MNDRELKSFFFQIALKWTKKLLKIVHIENVEANCTKRTRTTTIAGLELAFYRRNFYGSQSRKGSRKMREFDGSRRSSRLALKITIRGEGKKHPEFWSGSKVYAHKKKKRENVLFMNDNELSVCASVKVHIIKIKSFHFSFVSASGKDGKEASNLRKWAEK